MTSPELANRDSARRFNEEVWGRSDFDAIDEFVAEDFVGHSPARSEPVRGPDGVREAAEMLLSAFPDVQVDLEAVVADGDWIAERNTIAGTHEGEFVGIEPTGRRIEITGMNVTRFEDGKWVEGYELWDTFGLLRQFGVVDPPTR